MYPQSSPFDSFAFQTPFGRIPLGRIPLDPFTRSRSGRGQSAHGHSAAGRPVPGWSGSDPAQDIARLIGAGLDAVRGATAGLGHDHPREHDHDHDHSRQHGRDHGGDRGDRGGRGRDDRAGRGAFGVTGPFGPDGPFGRGGPFGPDGPFAGWTGGWPGGGHGRGGGPGGRPGGRPGARGRTRARRGDVRAAVLALLAEQPRNGYQLMQEISERSNGSWRPSPGSIYPALSLLEDEGLVTDEGDGGNRLLTLTDAGREWVAAHTEEIAAVWASLGEDDQPTDARVEGLREAVARLAAAVVQVSQAGGSGQVDAARDILVQARRDLYRLLADDDDAPGDDSSDDTDDDTDDDTAGGGPGAGTDRDAPDARR